MRTARADQEEALQARVACHGHRALLGSLSTLSFITVRVSPVSRACRRDFTLVLMSCSGPTWPGLFLPLLFPDGQRLIKSLPERRQRHKT